MPTVLLADDASQFREIVRDALQLREPDITVLEAGNGVEALEVIDANDVDLLVSEIRMPEMDGVELLAQLSQRGWFLPTICVSAHAELDVQRMARNLGAIAFIGKPVDLNELVTTVIETLRDKPPDTVPGVSVAGFLQLLALEERSCWVHVASGPLSGTLTVVEGVIIDAITDGLQGVAAALEMVRWRRVVLRVENLVGDVEGVVELPLHELLIELALLEGEESLGRKTVLDELRSSSAPIESSPPVAGKLESNLDECIQQLMLLDGAIAAALINAESGLALSVGDSSDDIDGVVAAAGNGLAMRRQFSAIDPLGGTEAIADILITLEQQYHLLRPLAAAPRLFLYLVLDRKLGNLALARYRLKAIEADLVVSGA